MGIVSIPLTQGKVAIIDEEDYPLVSQFKWHAASRNSGLCYAEACYGTRKEHGRWLMHRLIMNAPAGAEVDHRDGDGLNNTRTNLRLATIGQNRINSGPRSMNRSGYKGVYLRPGLTKWRAKLHAGGREYHLGYHDTPEEAARAWDAKARELFGEFARLNFPSD